MVKQLVLVSRRGSIVGLIIALLLATVSSLPVVDTPGRTVRSTGEVSVSSTSMVDWVSLVHRADQVAVRAVRTGVTTSTVPAPAERTVEPRG